MTPTDNFLNRVLSDPDPRALDLDAAVEIVVGQWMRATGSSLYEYRVSRMPGCRHYMAFSADPNGYTTPTGEGATIVEAYHNFIAALRADISRAAQAAE